MVSEPAVSDSSRGIRAGIHQQIEIERKNSFGDVDILPSILLIFTNKKQDSVFRGLKEGFCACVAEITCIPLF
jgi:hypothetical protein